MPRATAALLLVLLGLAVGGCALLAIPAAPDAPVPFTLRSAVEPARRALLSRWDRPAPVRFRFDGARCAIGAGAAMIFEQLVPDEPPTWALALSRDLAAGNIGGGWQVFYDVPDPATQPEVIALMADREIRCP